jgi:RNA polymerase sigma factor (sigma-70 family)
MPDENTLDAARRRAMVEDLYVRYGALVHRTCRAMLVDHHPAEDATQEVFARLVSHDDLTSVRDPRRWLLEVTRNHCIDRMRADARRPTTPIANGRLDAAEDAEARSVAREHLRWLLSLLTPRQRDVMVRQAVLDEPLDTVASRLGLSYGAASQALYRARAVLARAGTGGNGAVIVAGGRIVGLGRRLQSLVLRLSAAGRLQAGRVPLDGALALPAAALLVALLAGASATAHRQPAPQAMSPSTLAGGPPTAVRVTDPARQAAAVAVPVHAAAVSVTAPRAATNSAPAPPPLRTKSTPLTPLTQQHCTTVAGLRPCFPPQPTTIEVGGLPLAP